LIYFTKIKYLYFNIPQIVLYYKLRGIGSVESLLLFLKLKRGVVR